MRCCPKCGDKYEDADIRSMCASCMVSLVPYREPAAASVMDRPGPVSVGPAPIITATLPKVSVPETPPEVPQIPPAPPRPNPISPPLTPPPNPDYPQPIIIPEPEPVPEEPLPVAEEAAPEPEISIELMPDTRWAPAAEAHAPLQPSALPNLLAPPIIPEAGAAKPAAMPVPKQPAAQPESAKAVSTVRRPLTEGERGEGVAAAVGFGVLAGICLFILTSIVTTTDPEDINFFTVIFSAGFAVLIVVLIRQVIYRATIQAAKITLPPNPQLGAPMRFEVMIGTMRPLTVRSAELTLFAQERAMRSVDKSQSKSVHTLFTRTMPLSAPSNWPGGSLLAFHPHITLPADAVPSFSGKSNYIEWFAVLNVNIPGWFPDIRRRVPINIPAVRSGVTPPAASPHRYALPSLGDLQATIEFDCATTTENIPLLAMGTQIPFTLTIQPKEAGESKKIWIELVYLITGSGDSERIANRVVCFRGGWKAGIQQHERGILTIPVNGPISYNGKHIIVHWGINVRLEVPWQVDKQQAFEVVVTPRDVGG